jgi:anti-sigma B factor antagonist
MFTIDNQTNHYVVGFAERGHKLTALNANEFKDQLYQLIDNDNKKIVIDLNHVSFIDSSGFGAIIAVYNHARNSQVDVVLCRVATSVMGLIKITKLDQVFEIYETLTEAIK